LFSISLDKESKEADLCDQVEGRREWRLSWRRELYQWMVDLARQLMVELEEENISEVEDDKRVWVSDASGRYSVKSAYQIIMKEGPNRVEETVTKI